MQRENSELILIKAICSRENRKRLKKLLLGALLLNVAGFSFMYLTMYGFMYLMDFINNIY